MRFESSVTSPSWIPLEATEGFHRLTFGLPGCRPLRPAATRRARRPRRAGDLRPRPVRQPARRPGSRSRTAASSTPASAAAAAAASPGWATARPASPSARMAMPDLRAEPEVCPGWVRFTQTAGGVVAIPTPRRVRHQLYVQIAPSIPWTTLSLTMPTAPPSRGWSAPALSPALAYDHGGRLVAKSGFIDYDAWWREAFGSHTPWGDEDSAPIVTAVESALERQPRWPWSTPGPGSAGSRRGRTLVRQGEPGDELFLLFDGVLRVEVDGSRSARSGPARSWGRWLPRHRGAAGRPPCGR